MWCAVGKCLSRLSSSSGGSSGMVGGDRGKGLVGKVQKLLLFSVLLISLRQGTPHQQREGALLAYERAVQCDDREVLCNIHFFFRTISCFNFMSIVGGSH